MSTSFKNRIKKISGKVFSRSSQRINSHIDYNIEYHVDNIQNAQSNLVNFGKTLGGIFGSIVYYEADTYAEKCFFAGSRLFVAAFQLSLSLTIGFSPYVENGEFELEKSDLGFLGCFKVGHKLAKNLYSSSGDAKVRFTNVLIEISNMFVAMLVMNVAGYLYSAGVIVGLSIMAISLAVVLPIEKICEQIKEKFHYKGYDNVLSQGKY